MIDAGRREAGRGEAAGGAPGRCAGPGLREAGRRSGDQRSRLLDALVAVVGEQGYAGARIGQIASAAGVSRATFYTLFADKAECFAAAHEQLSRRIGASVERAVAAADPARAGQAALAELAELAELEPAAFAFVAHEALLAGAPAWQRRDRLLACIAHTIERAWAELPRETPGPGIPAAVLVGGAMRLLAMQLRRSGAVSGGLTTWVDAYALPAGPWRRREPMLAPAAARDGAGTVRPSSPRTLPRGRHRLPRDVVEGIQRERIAYATAEATRERGVLSVAVADIVAAAGVSREVFYTHFADKEDAFLATHQLIFEQLMAATSSAFFVPDTPWPERVWAAADAFAALLASKPSFAHFALVSAYGIGEAGVRRVDETILAFGLFLEEGFRYRPQAAALPRLVADAVAMAIMEVFAVQVRDGRTADLPTLVPTFAYTALAPFMGAPAAGEFVDRRLRGLAPGPPAP